jgi:mono/diheme cytochrome c family protein
MPVCYKRGIMRMPRVAFLVPSLGLLACGAFLSSCPDSAPVTGPELFNAWGCVQCHAENGTGVQGLGPPLLGKGVHWTRETLTQYLRDPAGFAAKTPRLKEQGRGFMTPMPPVLTKDEIAVGRLIDHVLTLAAPSQR